MTSFTSLGRGRIIFLVHKTYSFLDILIVKFYVSEELSCLGSVQGQEV
jgi:hypothetical protein